MKTRSMRDSVRMETTPPLVLARQVGLTNFHGAGEGGKEGGSATVIAIAEGPVQTIWLRTLMIVQLLSSWRILIRRSRQLRQWDKNRPKRIPLDLLREDKMDPPIHTDCIHSGGATTNELHRVEPTPSVPSSCVQRCIRTWSCSLTTRHWRTKSCGCQSRVSNCSENKYRGFRRLKAWLEQHFRAAEAFDAKKKFRLVEQPP